VILGDCDCTLETQYAFQWTIDAELPMLIGTVFTVHLPQKLRFMETIDLANLEFTAEPHDVDEDQFVSIWNVAASTMDGDVAQARALASRFLGFLCKHRCPLLAVSPSDAKYLDEWFERNNSLLYDWKPESEKVDVVTQHVHVPFDLFRNFLRDHKFQGDKNYSPRRADRVEWFANEWNVA
jgi:hypothetical protein